MTLTQLAYFVRIAELGSLSRAAAVLRIAQPALSRQVRLLEAELGAVLLSRHAKGVTPTTAGEVLLDHARRALRAVEDASESVRALSVEPAGRVAVGVPASLSRALLPLLAAKIRERHPAVRLHLLEAFSASLHARTLSGELDLAVLYDDRSNAPLATAPLLTDTLLLITSAAEGPPAVRSLDTAPLIVPARPNRLRLLIDLHLANRQADAPELLEVDSVPAVAVMVKDGLGWTILPFACVADEVVRGELRTWPTPLEALQRTLVLARPQHRPPSAAVAAVERALRQVVDQLSGPFRWRAASGHAGRL